MSGTRAVARCDALGVAPFSDTPDGLFRSYLSPAYRAAQRAVAGWMTEAGMATRIDAAGNLVGRYDGLSDGPALIIGSHLDSVRDAGRYDGPLGIMLGIECVAALHAAGRRPYFPIEVYAFGDEEGSRFPLAMMTSRAVAGALGAVDPAMTDGDGVSLAAALDAYRAGMGLADAALADAGHSPALAYLEAHIEQGPVLEAEGLALGAVTGIAAQKRFAVTVTGIAGHAGTNAMYLRRDALAAAAAMMVAAEAVASAAGENHVATVGTIAVAPGAANVVPGSCRFSLDVRAADDAACAALAGTVLARCEGIAAERDVGFAAELLHDLPASPCDPVLVALIGDAIAAEGMTVRRLMSGAGHDAMILSALCPTAMLFIRCRGGISHNPAESVAAEDCDVARRVLSRFIDLLEDQYRA